MRANVILLPGDGIGPEIIEQARRVLEAVARHSGHEFELAEHPVGGAAMDAFGVPLTDEAFDACRRADAVLLGAVGGPKWDDPSAPLRPEQGLFRLRFGLGLYANLRPVRAFPGLEDCSPLKRERADGVDLLIVRELTGGLYFGQPCLRETTPEGLRAVDTLCYTEQEVRRVVRLAFIHASERRKLVTSVDKANALETSRLWRQVASEAAKDFPDVRLEHQLVDSCAMRLVTNPKSFDVIVTENMFGDILSDEAAVIGGSLGLLPSASLGDSRLGLYEPIHGSAPDITGQGIANPLGTILSAALLLRHSLGLEREAQAVEHAVERAVADGVRTRDLDPSRAVSTRAMGDAVLERLHLTE
jgi:3-isopropylmalate dehydrogenase